MSWSELSDSGICSVRSDCVCGRIGARSMTETTWVIPRLVSCASSRAVKRSVRYSRGSTSLAMCPRRRGGRRPLRCCAAARRDVCHGWGLKESISRRGEVGDNWRIEGRLRSVCGGACGSTECIMKVSSVLGRTSSTCLILLPGCFSIIVPSICQLHGRPQIRCNRIVTVLATEHWSVV